MRHRKLIPIYIFYLLVALYIVRNPLMGALRGAVNVLRPRSGVDDVRKRMVNDDVQSEVIQDDVQNNYVGHQLEVPGNNADTQREDEVVEKGNSDGEGKRLILVQVLFRHGHSSPTTLYVNDPNPTSVWPKGPGQLTELGSIQNSMLGTHLRDHYWNFLTFNTKEVYCMSSGEERCRSAANVLLSSMYMPMKNPKEPPDKQPIPVNYAPEGSGRYFPSVEHCPASSEEMRLILQGQESLEFIQTHRKLYEFWTSRSGAAVWSYENAEKLFEILSIEKAANLEIPSWAKVTWDQLQYQAYACYYFRFKTFAMRRLMAGPLIALMIERMTEKVHDPKQGRKVYLYSGTGNNLAAMLQALGFFHVYVPPDASYLAFELHRGPGEDHYVRILYSNASDTETNVPPPRVLVPLGGDEYFLFEHFAKYVDHLVSDNWEAECKFGINMGVLDS